MVVRDGDGQHGHGGEAANEDRKSVGEPGDERVAACQTREPAVELTDPGERVVLPAEGRKLRRATQQLHELRGQRAACRRLPPPHRAGQPKRGERDDRPCEDEADGKRDGGSRRGQSDGEHTCDRNQQRDEGRSEPA